MHMNLRPHTAGRAGTEEGALLGLLPEDLKREVMSRIAKKQKIQAKAEQDLKKERSKSPTTKQIQKKPHDPRLALYHSHSTASNRDIYADTQHSNDMVADSYLRGSGQSKIVKPSWTGNPFGHNLRRDGVTGLVLNMTAGQKFSTMKQQTASSQQELSQGDQQQPMGSNSLDQRGLRIRASDEPRDPNPDQSTKNFLKIGDIMRAGVRSNGRGSSPEFTTPEDELRFGGQRDEMVENGTYHPMAAHHLHPNKYSELVDREQIWRRLQYGNLERLNQMTREKRNGKERKPNGLSNASRSKKPAPSSRRSTLCLVTCLRGKGTRRRSNWAISSRVWVI